MTTKFSEKNICECMHWKHEHLSKRSWIMGVLFGGEPGKCNAKDIHGIDMHCQCEGFDAHIPIRDK